MNQTATKPNRVLVSTLTGIGLAIGVLVAVIASDVILGVIAGASFIAITVGLVRLWTGGDNQQPHP
jgi:arginine repressor